MTDNYSPTTVFSDYGIGDGDVLVERTCEFLSDTDSGDAGSPEFFDRLAAAFRIVFTATADLPEVPLPVAAAIDDAVHVTAERYADSSADPRTVVPAFYRAVAGYYQAYRDPSPGSVPGRDPDEFAL